MAVLNDKTACYLWTNSETFNGEKIAIKKTSLPQYISYVIDKNNNVTESLDFGLPREMYVDKVNYSEDTTIYANFWDSFYRDQFNVNTKKVTCYVKLERAKQDLLRKFYFFDNAIWLLNKIDSYDVTSYGTTRCEFIKVQDMNNYLYKLVTQDLGFGQQIEDSLKKIQLQKEMNDAEILLDEEVDEELIDEEYEEFYDEIREQKEKDMQVVMGGSD